MEDSFAVRKHEQVKDSRVQFRTCSCKCRHLTPSKRSGEQKKGDSGSGRGLQTKTKIFTQTPSLALGKRKKTVGLLPSVKSKNKVLRGAVEAKK